MNHSQECLELRGSNVLKGDSGASINSLAKQGGKMGRITDERVAGDAIYGVLHLFIKVKSGTVSTTRRLHEVAGEAYPYNHHALVEVEFTAFYDGFRIGL